MNYLLRGYWLGPVFLAFVTTLVVAELAGRSVVARSAAALVVGLLIACFATGRGPKLDTPQVFGIAAWLTVTIAVTALVRTRREAARQRDERLAEESRRIATEGRLELARDLHDVLAHSLSLINVQAGTALHLIEDDPSRAVDALALIKKVSRDTLVEVRLALAALRGGEPPSMAATVGLHDIHRLIDTAHQAGLTTTVEVCGEARDLPPRVDIAAYRILQESLNNVGKHSAATEANVHIDYRPDSVVLTVTDPGPRRSRVVGSAPHGGGHGLPGMEERTTAVGGRLAAGPDFGGGFTVTAHLPAPKTA
jgi:signal transduction histidine kinase